MVCKVHCIRMAERQQEEVNMNKKLFGTREMVASAMLMAILLIMSFTPLGYLNVGPLAISFNMIPVAIGAITLGPLGGLILGAVFGLTSFLQCIKKVGAKPLILGVVLWVLISVVTLLVVM